MIGLGMKQKLIEAVENAAIQLCGTSHSTYEIRKWAADSITFPNKTNRLDGKPHDVEIRIAFCLFHHCRKQSRNESKQVELISDYGVKRLVRTPLEIANLFCQILNQEWDVRVDNSGIMCLVTAERSRALRASGVLPCPRCVKWCKGEKGLWWHQQFKHGIKHHEAIEQAATERNDFAIILYNDTVCAPLSVPRSVKGQAGFRKTDEAIFEYAREGKLECIKSLKASGVVISNDTLDRKGASPLHWAAGYGQLAVAEYLVIDCHCDPNVGQRGKRSFSGRTPLHWAARNGHLHVVEYLVEACHVNVNATTADGTTAFCWASWEGHLDIMKFLHNHSCDVHKINTFGCNAVLWCAQGAGSKLESIQWLEGIGCDIGLINSNGHGALHKAAQRGRCDLVNWLCQHVDPTTFAWIGPDSDGCCPSDLAGMEGHGDLAINLASFETKIAHNLIAREGTEIPDWMTATLDDSKKASCAWGPRSGTLRLRKALSEIFEFDRAP